MLAQALLSVRLLGGVVSVGSRMWVASILSACCNNGIRDSTAVGTRAEEPDKIANEGS